MRHTISILTDDTPGVLTRISSLFSRRGFNIESLSVGHTERPGKSRFTIVVEGDEKVLEQVRKQLQKLVHVIKAWGIWILEVTGDTSAIDNAFNLFKHYKIIESIRTGKISLERGSGKATRR